jgi:polysaccharide lyase-like protein
MTFSTRRLRHLLTAFLAIAAASLALASSASARVLQASTAEHAWNQEWASWSCANSSRFSEVTSPANQGRHAYELTVHDGDDVWGERCELGHGNPGRSGFPLFHSGDDVWMSFSVYLPDNYPINTHNWNVMFQIHQEADGGCPPIAMEVQDGQWKLYNSTRPTYVMDTVEKWHAPAQRNRWTKFTIHMMNSGSDSKGFIELYSDVGGNGMEQVMPRTYMHTMTIHSDGSPYTNHARIGIYRDKAIQGTTSIYFDGFTIATDRASAEASAFGAADSSTDNGTSGDTTPGNTDTGQTPSTLPSTIHRRRRAPRVVLRPRRRARNALSAAGWPRLIPVYGWVKGRKHLGARSVVIEIKRNGHWRWLTRGWLRANGRFYLAPAVDVGSGRKVALRAHVQHVGYSKVITARV